MLVVGPQRLHERDGAQRAGLRGRDELGLVAQVLGLRGGAVGEVGEAGERLVMELEQRIGMPGQGVPIDSPRTSLTRA